MRVQVKSPQVSRCKDVEEQPFPFTMAFQPIVDVETRSVYAYEALVRGVQGEPAEQVLRQVTRANRHAFDQHCQIKAVTIAAALDLAKTTARLSINVMPGVVHETRDCAQRFLDRLMNLGLPCDRIIFEMSESQNPRNQEQLEAIAEEYRRCGFLVAMDDFGAGHSGLSRLAEMSMDILKIDKALIRNLPQRTSAQAIVRCLVDLAESLGNVVVAEGIETIEEHNALRACGVRLMQGYLFAKPAFERLPAITLPAMECDEMLAV